MSPELPPELPKYGVPGITAGITGIMILKWTEYDRGVKILAVEILIAEGKHGKLKIIAQSSYNTIVQRISGI